MISSADEKLVRLAFLLDEHLSPTIATQVAAKRPGIRIVAMQDWADGAYLGADDAIVLAQAHVEQMTLVTYDQRTIIPLLRTWAEQGAIHGGVVFVDELTIAQNDIGRLVRSLCALWDAKGDQDWTNRVEYLTRG